MSEIEVQISLDGRNQRVGTLFRQPARRRETDSFAYHEDWLGNALRFSLEPALQVGKGLFHPNSADNIRGGCGSCYNPYAQRDAYLSEAEATYALALFCKLKGIPNSDVTPHLKRQLRGIYRKSIKDISGKVLELERLVQIKLESNFSG